MKEYKLSDCAKFELQDIHNKTHNARTRDRLKAILLYDEGWSFEDIAEVVYKNKRTVRRHIEDYHQNKKITSNNGGSKSRLDEKKLKK